MGLKLRTAIGRNNEKLYSFHCNGCGHSHAFNDQWTFNGDMSSPSFSPSLLNYLPDNSVVCHLFVKNGKIEYLSDCTHDLAGKTVEMEVVNE